MMTRILYHGTKTGTAITDPDPTRGKGRPDFGRAFYLTDNLQQACQWATRDSRDGFVQIFECNFSNLRILNFLEIPDSELLWLGTLARCRLGERGRKTEQALWLMNYASIDVSKYDLVIGHLGDDKISDILNDFCQGLLPLEGAVNALRFTKLHPQYAVRTKQALYFDYNEAKPTNKRVIYRETKNAYANLYNKAKRDASSESVTHYENLKLSYQNDMNDPNKRCNMTFLSDIYKEYRGHEDILAQKYLNSRFTDACDFHDVRTYDEEMPTWRWMP